MRELPQRALRACSVASCLPVWLRNVGTQLPVRNRRLQILAAYLERREALPPPRLVALVAALVAALSRRVKLAVFSETPLLPCALQTPLVSVRPRRS